VALWRLEGRADIVAPLLTDVQVDAILARLGGGWSETRASPERHPRTDDNFSLGAPTYFVSVD